MKDITKFLEPFNTNKLIRECGYILPVGDGEESDFYDEETGESHIEEYDFYSNFVENRTGVMSFAFEHIYLKDNAPITVMLKEKNDFFPYFSISLTVYFTGEVNENDIPQGYILKKSISLITT